MDNKTEVLTLLLDEVNRSLKQVCDTIDRLSVQKKEISQDLKDLYNNEDNLEKRKKVLEEIINDENLKLGIIKTKANDGIIAGMDMSNGPDMAAIVKAGAQITSPHYPGEAIATEMHIIKSNIAREASKEIVKRMERDLKHGKV